MHSELLSLSRHSFDPISRSGNGRSGSAIGRGRVEYFEDDNIRGFAGETGLSVVKGAPSRADT